MQVAAEVFLIVSLLMVFAPKFCLGAFFCLPFCQAQCAQCAVRLHIN